MAIKKQAAEKPKKKALKAKSPVKKKIKKVAGVDKLWGMGLKAPQNKKSPYKWDKDLWR